MLQIASYTDMGGRAGNEDCVRYVLSAPRELCLVVADGLGGHGGGAQAADAACGAICGGWTGRSSPAILTDLFQAAHRSVTALQTPQCAMKSTAVALTVTEERAAWAHVGDSRLYHFYEGRLVFQTRDHSASQIAVALGDITPDQIRFHEDRSRVLRALGQEGSLKVEAREEALMPGGHAFLLCTDGFWEYVLEAEMEAELRRAAEPKDWLEKMREHLKRRIPTDNDNNSAAAVWLEQR